MEVRDADSNHCGDPCHTHLQMQMQVVGVDSDDRVADRAVHTVGGEGYVMADDANVQDEPMQMAVEIQNIR